MTSGQLPLVAQPEQLTETLRRAGVLDSNAVTHASIETSRNTILSSINRLRLSYAAPEAGAPLTLIYKTCHPDRLGNADWDPGRQEVQFYNEIATKTHGRLIPRCFQAEWNSVTRMWHILLEDLAATHTIATAWPLPPTLQQCTAIVRARARFQAEWWDDPRFGEGIGKWLPADDKQILSFEAAFARFVEREGDRLSEERRDLYRRLIDNVRQLNRRYHSHRNMTIVQGDAHFWNCFLPKDGGDDVRLFDWDCWRIDVGTDDLAYAIAMHWYPDRRRRFEHQLLDEYHATLVANGVAGYDRSALESDYRLSVLWQIATPVWQSNGNIPPLIWWNNLERIMLAVDDLDCRSLLLK